MAKKRKKGTKSEERVKFLTNVGNINAKNLRGRATEWEIKFKKILSDLHYSFKFQYPIITQKRHLYILDFLLVDYNIFIEIDSKKWHSSREQIKHDNLRSARLKREGYFPIRITNSQVATFTKEQIKQIIELKILLLKEVNKLGKTENK